MKIEDIPDYPALQQLGRALWKMGKARGAAILVGAGFSRNADRIHANTPEPPLWTDIARVMQKRIYPDGVAQKAPLRLAEEFKVLLGEPALEGLIRDMVRDEEWLPGELHRALVKLPWTDILTTNWDTLIERAALENLGQTYETVRCIGDIATTRAPRVVKLHGSLPSNRPFILSEEDYRTYPSVFAPFVNLVQQTLLENELCLLGFSGDDPNFLEWSGWVRDQLGASARRIHIVGALDLGPAQRKLLESRNISAIDLTPLVVGLGKARHRAAASEFLNYLEKAKPRAQWDWPGPRKSTAPATTFLDTPAHILAFAMDTLRTWETQRLLYPGWVICPPHIRSVVKRETIDALYLINRVFDQLSPHDRGSFLFELAWRLDTFFVPLLDWLQPLFRSAVLDDECWGDVAPREFVALLLLRTAREERNQSAFAEWVDYFKNHATSDPETAAQVRYQRCLWARDELNFRQLKELLIDFEGSDPFWKFRCAALLCDLGDMKGARETVNIGLRKIREHFYRDRDSVWTISRLAWAQFLSRGLRSWTTIIQDEPVEESEVLRLRFFETKSDPWESLQAIDIKIEEDLRRVAERNREKQPQFEAGVYRDHSSTLHFGTWWPTEAIYEIDRIVDVVGAPSRADHTIIMAERMERAELLTGYRIQDDSDFLRVLRVAHAAGENFVESVFGRIQVAVTADNRRTMLGEVLGRALDYALQQLTRREGFADDFWSRRAAVYAEIISRLSVRLSGTEALALFRRGLSYAKDPRWRARELYEALGHLLKRSLSAISPSVRRTLAEEMLSFPLPDEVGIASALAQDWPEIAEWLPEPPIARPTPDTQFAARVSILIEKTAHADAENRNRAARRLAGLYMGGSLNAVEAERFGKALWGRRQSETDFPADTLFYSHMFLLLPSPDKNATRALFMAHLNELSSTGHLVPLAAATRKQKDGSRGLLLTKEEARSLLGSVIDWRPRKEPGFDLGNTRRENELSRQTLGAVMANAILPSLMPSDLTSPLIEDCVSLIETNVAPSVTQALPELVRIQPSLLERATNLILQMMVSIDSEKSSAGFHAAFRWAVMAKEGTAPAIPRRVVDSIVNMIETRREPGLLPALRNCLQLLNDGILTHVDQERLIPALGSIFIETEYAQQNPNEIETIGITLLRAAAIRLADGLKGRGISDDRLSKLLADAELDPMPEVRFAAADFPD
jgi:hypothetical protein